MASRRILSNDNLAPIQEVAVNPYNSFNSDSINKLTRIVSGGKDKDVVVNGLDVSSFTDKKWYAGPELLPELSENSTKWTGENYYILDRTQDESESDTVLHLELPHQNSYGFSYIKCKIDDTCVKHLYRSTYSKFYEVRFTLRMGTPKTIVAKLNDCEVTIEHPKQGETYSLKLEKIFKHDTIAKGLTFTFGAVLDGADPDCVLMSNTENKTYIEISNIGFRMLGYEFPDFPRSPGPAEDSYSIYGIHPTHIVEISPGVAIKDDVMLEEMSPSINKFKRFRLDVSDQKSWIKSNPYQISDFKKTGKKQIAYQCNDNGDVYQKRTTKFQNNKLQVKVRDNLVNGEFLPGKTTHQHWIYPTDDIVLTKDINGQVLDYEFEFNYPIVTDEFHNFTLHSDGLVLQNITSYDSTVIVCFVDDDGQYHVIGYKKNVIKGGPGIDAPNIDPNTEDITNIDASNRAPDILFDNGSHFEIPIMAYTLPDSILAYQDRGEFYNRIKGFVSIGPTKVSGDPDCFEPECAQWGYIVLYYAYFKNPKPNTSYIGIIRESDLSINRDDYLVLAKVRFIDPYTVDIISYENRQSKQIPRCQDILYAPTCAYPEIWDGEEVPETVTDAINRLALFDHNFARLIRFKHDYDEVCSTTFNLTQKDNRNFEKTPFIHVNKEGHLERKLRVDQTVIHFNNFSSEYAHILPPDISSKTIDFVLQNDGTYQYIDPDTNDIWKIDLNAVLTDIPLNDQFGLSVKAVFGKYDRTGENEGIATWSCVSFNETGPFKFVDINNGKFVCEMDWIYHDESLEYPTSPDFSIYNQTLVYPTAPYSTCDVDGKYCDVDEGDINNGKYRDNHNELNGGRFLLSYNNFNDGDDRSYNSKRNHFSYLTFRSRLLISDYFLRLLDILPKYSVGVYPDGSHAEESLINKRILIGSNNGGSDNVHIESSDCEISEDMKNGNLLHSERQNNVSVIKSTRYAIPNKKDKESYAYVNDNSANYQLVNNAVLTSKKRDNSTTDIISSNYTISASGNNCVLNSKNTGSLIDIRSTSHEIDNDFINGNIIRAKTTDKGDIIESSPYAVPNKKTVVTDDSGKVTDTNYDFTNKAEESNYSLVNNAVLVSKKRNDKTTDIISSDYTLKARGNNKILVSKKENDLISIESSVHEISSNLVQGNLIIDKKANNGSDILTSSPYSIPDTKSTGELNPFDAAYSYTGNGTYQLKDSALLISKKRDANSVDIISSKYTITAAGDKKIIISDYKNPADKNNSLIELKSSEYTVGDIVGHWYKPKVELRCDSWWNNGKPRIVLVIDTIHNFTIKFSQIVREIDNQFNSKYCYGDVAPEFKETEFKELFNSNININDKRICDITVVLDLTAANNRKKYYSQKDGYDVLEAACSSKFILINDCNKIESSDGKFKPYVKMIFDYSDSVKSENANIHYVGDTVIYGFDTNKEFTGTIRSAEHLHSEPLKYLTNKWILTPDYETTEKNIIWTDMFRGYNNTRDIDTKVTKMVLYPVANKENLDDTSASLYDPDDTKSQSGFEFCRGPLIHVYAECKAEYTFNHIKTLFDPSGITYPTGNNGNPLFTCSKCNDIIYADCKYYISTDQF